MSITGRNGRARARTMERSDNSDNPGSGNDSGHSDDLMTTQEVAAMCRTTEGTVRSWRSTGCGPEGFKVGKRVLYRRSEVDGWLREQHEKDRRRRGVGEYRPPLHGRTGGTAR